MLVSLLYLDEYCWFEMVWQIEFKIPPLKPTPPEERMDIIIPEGDSVELSNEMIYNFAQCMP